MDHSPRRYSIGRLLVLLGLVVLFVWVYASRQDIADWAKLRNYTPSAQIVSVNDSIGLTPLGQKLLYVNRPEVYTSRTDFAGQCPVDMEKTIVLGCYITGDRGIFLFEPSDSRLAGVVETTAAHELLHAAYERLPSDEKSRIDALLTTYYETGLTDERIKKTIASYKQADAEIPNEMHSIFGTEVAELPAELETYYGRYFSDRKLVLQQLARYQDEFTRREVQVAAYDAQLKAQKGQIESLENSVKANLARLNSIQAQLTAYAAQDDYGPYNALIPTYNNLVETYNDQLDRLNASIVTYNQTVELRNDLAVEEGELLKALSGSEESEFNSL